MDVAEGNLCVVCNGNISMISLALSLWRARRRNLTYWGCGSSLNHQLPECPIGLQPLNKGQVGVLLGFGCYEVMKEDKMRFWVQKGSETWD